MISNKRAVWQDSVAGVCIVNLETKNSAHAVRGEREKRWGVMLESSHEADCTGPFMPN